MRVAWSVLAVLLILAGGTFALQGLNILLGSFMSGSPTWLDIGIVMLMAGLLLLIAANWPRKTKDEG
jgi:hypothetical protein